MPVAAVPNYLGQDFKDASPGMRFGMYLKLWGVNRRTQALPWSTYDVGYEVRGQNRQEREVKYENKGSALTDAKNLNDNDKRTMHKLIERQQRSFDASALPEASVQIEAIAIAPFTTGLGNEHPLENGFAFLNPYGLPYLPGSGVKGVLRQAAHELVSGQWGDTLGWTDAKSYMLRVGKQAVSLSMIEVLFGLESGDGDTEHVRGVLAFWDVIPQIKGDALQIEVMTPHQLHYYQQDQNPHESGQPKPICFLTVPPGSGFTFHITCDLPDLQRLAPELAESGRWKKLVRAAFTHAFDWLGFGAKTAVGYGAMAHAARQDASKQPAAAQSPSPIPSTPVEEIWQDATVKYNVSTRLMTVVKDGRKAEKKEAKSLFDNLQPASLQKKAREGRFQADVRVRRGTDGTATLLGFLLPAEGPV